MNPVPVQRSPCQTRDGSLSVAVLVILAVVMMLFSASIRLLAVERKELSARQDRMQTECLADAGLRRARAQLALDDAYTGETWPVESKSLAGHGDGIVHIHVTTIADRTDARQVRATAEYPQSGQQRCRRTREIVLTLTAPESQQ